MGSITRPSFWLQLFMSTFLTMVMIYLIKKASNKLNIPVVQDIANEVY